MHTVDRFPRPLLLFSSLLPSPLLPSLLKDKAISKQREKILALELAAHGEKDSDSVVAALTAKCNKLQRNLHSVETFLADYGKIHAALPAFLPELFTLRCMPAPSTCAHDGSQPRVRTSLGPLPPPLSPPPPLFSLGGKKGMVWIGDDDDDDDVMDDGRAGAAAGAVAAHAAAAPLTAPSGDRMWTPAVAGDSAHRSDNLNVLERMLTGRKVAQTIPH